MHSAELDVSRIESKIFLIRGEKVLLGPDLAKLYQVSTRRLNEQVRRNSERFPVDFMFELSEQELRILRSQFATSSSEWGGHRRPPLAFTEQGVAMLSSVLNSERAIEARYDGHFKKVFDAIRELISTRAVPRKRIIGLEPPESSDGT